MFPRFLAWDPHLKEFWNCRLCGWLEAEAEELEGSHLAAFWTIGFAVPLGRLSDADSQ